MGEAEKSANAAPSPVERGLDNPPAKVLVWCSWPEGVTEADLDAFGEVLSDDELDQVRHFRNVSSRREYALAHVLSRLQLSKELHLHPRAWRFERNNGNKPTLAAPVRPAELDFNISHAQGCVASALCTGGKIGVDVEGRRRDPQLDTIAGLCLSENEYHFLKRLPIEERISSFYLFWTVKESLLKALGTGFSVPPTSIELDLSSISSGNPCLLKQEPSLPCIPWIRLFSPSENYTGAVTVLSNGAASLQYTFQSMSVETVRHLLSSFF